MVKGIVIKAIVVVVAWVLLFNIQTHVLDLWTADSAVLQLKDSDTAYLQFKWVQGIKNWFWLVYLLPLLVFFKEVRLLLSFKKVD